MTNDLTLLLEITRNCNLFCKHCYNYDLNKTMSFRDLEIDELKIILHKLVNAGINQLILTGGEPLSCKNLENFFQALKQYPELIFSINTNGILLLNDNVFKLFLENKDLFAQLNLSLESGDPEINDNIRGKGQFHNIIKVLELCYQEQIPLLVNTTIGSYNMNSIDSIFSLMDKYDINNVNFGLYIPWQSSMRDLKPLTRDQVRLMCDYLLEKEESGWNIQTCSMPYLKFLSPGIEGACCYLFKDLLTVNYKGDLTVCMMDNFKIGSILNMSLEYMMKTEKVREFLDPEQFKTKIRGKCATCVKFVECLGCRFLTYTMTQEYYASDPYCPYHFTE